jgi:small GTP-binding protein
LATLALLALVAMVAGIAATLAVGGDRLVQGIRFLVVPVAVLIIVGMIGAAEVVAAWQRQRPGALAGSVAPPGEELHRKAEIQARRARMFVDRLGDPGRRRELIDELKQIEREASASTVSLQIVAFGTGSAGKTSLINALVGRNVGITSAVMGTTPRSESVTHVFEGTEGVVQLVDTPGLAEAGAEGPTREREARALAARADLLLFVIDHDLLRGEYEALVSLARLGKRSLVVLNKQDRFPADDLAAILARLRQRLAGVIEPEDIIPAAAAPVPVPVRLVRPDGSTETSWETPPPEIEAVRRRIVELLGSEAEALLTANRLVRGKLVEQAAREELERERAQKGEAVVERYQWIAAGTVFANPIPAFDLLAGGAVQLELIAELARAMEIEFSPAEARGLAGQMAQALLRLGLIEAATSLIAGLFKRSLVGFAAAGAVQAVTIAYLTRISGAAYVEYFAQGRSWGEGGIEGSLLRQFARLRRSQFLQEFAARAVEQMLQKVSAAASPSGEGRAP